MPKNPPIKNTAGEGFAVEDMVVAHLVAHLLLGLPWPGAGDEEIVSIQCQGRQDGWSFDDAILTLRSAESNLRCACSIKSFAVFGRNGAPLEFAQALWEQWLDPDSSRFQRGKDRVTLVAAQHEPQIREAWFGLCDSARVTPSEILANRCLTGEEPSTLRCSAFKSLQLGGALSNRANDPVETARMLGAFRLWEHDFQHSESQSGVQARLLCQQALTDSERWRAPDLWAAIVEYASRVRRKGGSITLPDLLAKLAPHFPLKQHPNYARDWATILRESQARMDALPVKIGGIAFVNRPELLASLDRLTAAHTYVAVLGESGDGKSVLACDWAKRVQGVWIRAGDLSVSGGLRATFILSHGLGELFANTSRPLRLVLDGLDKCFDEAAFGEASLLLKAASTLDARDRFQVVVTCCPEDWERVRGQLIRRQIVFPKDVVKVGKFTEAEMRSVCDQVPSLHGLRYRPHLHSLLRWPKALDMVATYWQASNDAPLPWVTESDFARWFWLSAISQDKPASFRDQVARKLAVHLADQMLASARLDTFSREEGECLAELAHDGHIQIDAIRRTVTFSHELIADWARQRELQIQDSAAGEFLKTRLHSPFWHRAVRFHGLELLETRADSAEWEGLFASFQDGTPTDAMGQNLLLEAPIFAVGQRVTLERLWPILQRDDGRLLQRFLRQFMRVATIPDESRVAQFPGLEIEAATLFRLPWAPYWRGVLAVLAAHTDEACKLAPEELADVCLLWLRLHGAIPVGMDHAAKIAVALARGVYQDRERWYGHRQETSAEEKICQALFAAAPEMPTEVAELALKLSGRKPPDPDDNLEQEPEIPTSRFYPDPGPLTPWPEGPQCSGAKVFCNAFLSPNHAAPFLRVLPDVGIEVMFAVLLSLPRKNWDRRHGDFDLDEHGFAKSHFDHRTPLWVSGPFLTFLRLHPSKALSAIIKLVNFATVRALELDQEIRESISVPVTFEGETHIWSGHRFSYLWHQGHVFGPAAIGCAILSLEKWFYLLMDENEPFEEHLKSVLRESRSIALAALLVCVGKRRPELFMGTLRPLIEAADFMVIEDTLARSAEDGFRASAFYELSKPYRDAWREWVQMSHREESLGRLTLRMFIQDPKWREMIDGCRKTWQARLESATPEFPAATWLPRVISEFDIKNWRTETRDGQTYILYEPPQDLPQPTEEESARYQRVQLLTLLPFQCRQVLMGEALCSEEQMTDWWSKLQEVRQLEDVDGEVGFRDQADALCGIVAVAAVHHRAWLAADLSREQEAISILTEVGTEQPPRFWEVDDDISDAKWDIFAAWALTTLWCEKPDDPFLLQAVGALALWARHMVVSRVLSIAARHRAMLGQRFHRLLSHAIRYSPVCLRAKFERHLAEKTFDRDAWVSEHLQNFIAGKTEPLPASWKDLAEPVNTRKATSGMDIGHIYSALTWAENLSTAVNLQERKEWLNFHRHALLCALTRIQTLIAAPPESLPPYELQQELWPYDDERRLLQRVAQLVSHLSPDEDAGQIWEPIFALGCAAHRWVEEFIRGWMLESAGHEEPAPFFKDQWWAMLTYAETSAAWRASSGGGPSAHRKIWKRLLGFEIFGSGFWSVKLAAAVEATAEFHHRWAETHVQCEYDARSYIAYLRTAAAKSLRLDGLRILKQRIKLDCKYFWDGEGVRDSIAGFLRLLLDEHWGAVVSDSAHREAYMAFALKLTSLQHPLGCEVLNLAAGRLGKAS